MIKTNLYNTNAKQINNLYLEKSTKEDYLSKFFNYDKHKIKKKAFFYFRLISLKNKEKQKKKTKFYFSEEKNKKNLNFLHQALTNQTQLNKINLLPELWNESLLKASTTSYSPYVNLGLSSHKDNYQAYGKQDWEI